MMQQTDINIAIITSIAGVSFELIITSKGILTEKFCLIWDDILLVNVNEIFLKYLNLL